MFVNSSVHYRYRVNLTRSNTWSAQKIIVGLVNHKKVLQWLPRYIFGFGVGCRTTSGRDTPPSRRASQNFTEFSGPHWIWKAGRGHVDTTPTIQFDLRRRDDGRDKDQVGIDLFALVRVGGGIHS